jgi:hypothetical protein
MVDQILVYRLPVDKVTKKSNKLLRKVNKDTEFIHPEKPRGEEDDKPILFNIP